MKWTILAPYTIFILYLVWLCVTESNYAKIHKHPMDMVIVNQKNQLNEDAKNGHGHDAPAGHDAKKDASHDAHDETAKPAEGHH